MNSINVELPAALALSNYPMYVDPFLHARYLARYELYKRILEVEGNIVECGVAWGGGLLSWSQFSLIFEPFATTRRIYGFDTFDSSFPAISKEDGDAPIEQPFPSDKDHIENVIKAFSIENYNGSIKTYVVEGNATETIPIWCRDKPHALVSLLYLDFDVFEPTKTAIEHLLPRMPKGGIIAFDECNWGKWPGETIALLKTVGVRNVNLKRFPWCGSLAYCEA